jgi:hypothetical protein
LILIVAPLEALTDSRLTDPERRVLLALFSFRGKNTNTVWPGLDAISDRALVKDIGRVSKLTSSLASKGWLTKKKRGFTGCNQYTLTVPELFDVDANLVPDTKLDCDTNSNLVPDTKSNLAPDAKYKEQTKEQTIEQTNTDVSVGTPVNEYLFSQFWEAYPKKTAKAEAWKVWKKLNPSGELTNQILRHIDDRISSGEWALVNKQYIVNPASFLRNERWTDEIIGGGNENTSKPSGTDPNERGISGAERTRRARELRRLEEQGLSH